MKIVVVDDSKEKRFYEVDESLKDVKLDGMVVQVCQKSREESALEILKAYFSNAKPILYDCQNSTIGKLLDEIGLELFDSEEFSDRKSVV